MTLSRKGLLLGCRSGGDSVGAAIEAGVAVVNDRSVVDDSPIDIRVPNNGRIHGYRRGVVRELAAAPLTAGKAAPKEAESIVHAAVIADFRSPIAFIENVSAVISVTPIAGRPEISGLWRFDPGAGDPIVVANSVPGPVARCPHVVGLWAWRLNVHGKSRRREIDAD